MTKPSPLQEILVRQIDERGPISVHDFMSLVLGHPKHGYYARQTAFGAEGDFVTAPEISQIFGELIGLWAAQVWADMGAPAAFHLVELGPGRGTLMADAFRVLSKVLPAFTEAAEVHFVETSTRLRALQKEAMRPFGKALHWHDEVAGVPPGPMVLIANEFLDALPIHQYMRSHDGWYERLVGEGAAGPGSLGFCLSDTPVESQIAVRLKRLEPASGPAPVEALAELRPFAERLVQQLDGRIASQGGAALFVDYGYERSAPGDTFQAVKDHKPVHVLQDIGEADLTAHVDFEALCRSVAVSSALPVQSQGSFLKALGLDARLQSLLASARPDQRELLESGAQRLIDPDKMGSLFKVFAFHTPGLRPPPGFQDLDPT